MLRQFFPISAILMIVLILGCSGSQDESAQPVTPSTQPDITAASDEPVPGVNSSSRNIWGYWQCGLNAETGDTEIVPARTGLLHINAVYPLNNSMGIDVEIVPDGTNPPQGEFTLDVTITHPFPGALKFTGFDVRGILITTAQYDNNGMPLPGPNDPVLVNADGFTRWWNPVEFPTPGLMGYNPGLLGKYPPGGQNLVSTINPYMQFADGLYYLYNVSHLTLIMPTTENGRGVFRSGESNTRRYELNFPTGPGGPMVYFNYAVDASWDQPESDPPSIPMDFPLEANSAEAFIVDTEVTSNSLWAVPGSPQAGGELELEIDIWDWQGWLGDYDGEVGALKLVSPFCDFEDGVVPNITENTIGSATLSATLTGLASANGEIPVWVGVTAPGTSYKQGPWAAPDELVAAYDLITIEIAEAECTSNDNSDCTTADDIEAEDEREGLFCLGVDETDWFHFTVPAYASAYGALNLETYDVGDLSLLLYEGCPPDLVDYSSNAGTADEEISFTDLGSGEYYIQVLEVNDGDTSPRPYLFTCDINGIGEECTLDENNYPEDAEAVTLDGTKTDSVCLVGDILDWYTFTISNGVSGYGTIDLDNNNYADNDIALFGDPVDEPLYIGSNTGTVDEHMDIPLLDPGNYYVRIEAKGDDPSGDRDYELQMDLQEVVGDCDNADGNNTPGEAVQTSMVATETGTVCFPSDPDWFRVSLDAGEVSGEVTLAFPSTANNDLYIYLDPSQPPVYTSENAGSEPEEIEIDGIDWFEMYIRVAASSDVAGVNHDYTLEIDLAEKEYGPTDIFVQFHVVRTTQGTNPAADEATIQSHIDWANEFYETWFDGTVNNGGIEYVDNTAWLSLTTNEAETMFVQENDGSGMLHVFYVNDMPDMPGAAAYAMMDCQFSLQDHTTAYVVMSDYADDPTLAHEIGHACGLLADLYWLDWYTCEDIIYCPSGPSDIYCDEADAVNGNLMYWPVGSNIEDYFISTDDIEMLTPDPDSQAENMMLFNTLYPDAFQP